jgi:hypothetical protein
MRGPNPSAAITTPRKFELAVLEPLPILCIGIDAADNAIFLEIVFHNHFLAAQIVSRCVRRARMAVQRIV